MEALRFAVNHLAKEDVSQSVRLSIMYDHLKEMEEQKPVESTEDERIRQLLVERVRTATHWSVELRDLLLDYLEKQKNIATTQFSLGEQAGKEDVLYELEKRKDMVEALRMEYEKGRADAIAERNLDNDLFREGYEIGYEDAMRVNKPVEIHTPTDEEVESWKNELTEFKKFATKQAKENQLHISYTRDVMWENFCSELLSFVNSRKPVEWSEEDEKRLNAVIELLENTSAIHPNYSHRKLIIWLQDLRPQSKQEWSEEDEANFKWFDKFFRAESVIANGRDIPQDKYLWFKSLRPQPRISDVCYGAKGDPDPAGVWKPSEEQMAWLKLAVEEANEPLKSQLAELYKDIRENLIWK